MENMLPRQLIIHCLARPCRNPMAFLLLVHMCPSSLLRHLSRFLFLVFCLIHPLEVILRFLVGLLVFVLHRAPIQPNPRSKRALRVILSESESKKTLEEEARKCQWLILWLDKK